MDTETRERLDAPQVREISSLNAADLDVEELESRLEMAAAVPSAASTLPNTRQTDSCDRRARRRRRVPPSSSQLVRL